MDCDYLEFLSGCGIASGGRSEEEVNGSDCGLACGRESEMGTATGIATANGRASSERTQRSAT
jgi:hypothetical protein